MTPPIAAARTAPRASFSFWDIYKLLFLVVRSERGFLTSNVLYLFLVDFCIVTEYDFVFYLISFVNVGNLKKNVFLITLGYEGSSYQLHGVAPSEADPQQWNSTSRKNSPICNQLLFIELEN